MQGEEKFITFIEGAEQFRKNSPSAAAMLVDILTQNIPEEKILGARQGDLTVLIGQMESEIDGMHPYVRLTQYGHDYSLSILRHQNDRKPDLVYVASRGHVDLTISLNNVHQNPTYAAWVGQIFTRLTPPKNTTTD